MLTGDLKVDGHCIVHPAMINFDPQRLCREPPHKVVVMQLVDHICMHGFLSEDEPLTTLKNVGETMVGESPAPWSSVADAIPPSAFATRSLPVVLQRC